MKVGSLFSGYEGLGLAVSAVLEAHTVWCSDNDPGASKILAHHWPDVPNLGDITKVDWATVAPVDVLTGGFPCQDVSHAGKRKGMRPDTRSGLWTHMAYAIDQLRPSLVIAENVRGLLSADADSDMEPCPWCLGDGEDVTPLRALGAVLGDLADLGYDAQWVGLPAAGVGAPHGRFRVFVAAYPRGEHGQQRWEPAPGQAAGGRALGEPAGRGRVGALLPTPRGTDHHDSLTAPAARRHVEAGNGTLTEVLGYTLLPTPAVNDMGEGKTVEAWDEWTATMQARHGNGNGHGKSLSIEAQRLSPTTDWGVYADAIHRWETILGRPAPPPTQTSTKGNPQLSPAFTEWMQGLPQGHVTAVPGLTRNEQLKALGNGVVPQHADAALRWLLEAS